jgi:hypothetical protein
LQGPADGCRCGWRSSLRDPGAQAPVPEHRKGPRTGDYAILLTLGHDAAPRACGLGGLLGRPRPEVGLRAGSIPDSRRRSRSDNSQGSMGRKTFEGGLIITTASCNYYTRRCSPRTKTSGSRNAPSEVLGQKSPQDGGLRVTAHRTVSTRPRREPPRPRSLRRRARLVASGPSGPNQVARGTEPMKASRRTSDEPRPIGLAPPRTSRDSHARYD